MQPQANNVGFVVREGQRRLTLHRPTFAFGLFESAIPLLQQAAERSREYTVEDLYERCRQGKMQFWTVQDEADALQIAMVTGFVEYPQIKDLHIYALAGRNLRAALTFLPSIRSFMAWNEASRLTAAVRPQFMRVLTRYGFGELDRRAVLLGIEESNATRH
jgi:hypothetical protein